ncbi:tetratricopeptide repeat protein [candidate division KSB1 bacterium]|nr:tetratricopeptide repeat protein [candidate division KSB1 bacterium]
MKIIRIKINFLVTLICILLSIPGSGIAQDNVESMQDAFHRLDYATAQSIAESILVNWQQYRPSDLETVHKVLGVILYSDGDLQQAQRQFEQAIQLNRQAELDPVYVSPKIITFFNEIKAAYQPESGQQTQVRYVLAPDRRPGAVMRSALIPGWGQIHKGQVRKGWVLITAATASTVALVGTAWQTQQKRDLYMDATTPIAIESTYNTYNTWYKRRQVSGYIMGALWSVAIIDALVTKPGEEANQVSLQPIINHDVWAFCLQYTF